MKIQCPSCDQRLEIPEELAGQTIERPACNSSLAVPSLATPPPSPVQVQQSAPQVTASEKPKSSIPKWAIASVAGIAVLVVCLIMFFPNDPNGVSSSEPTAVKTDGESQQATTAAETKPIERVPGAKAPDISIHEAAEEGDLEAIKQHLAAGTDVDVKGWMAGTPLHDAAIGGQKEAIELLIAKGADVNAKNKDGRTPLHYSAGIGHKIVAEFLIAKGADVNAKNDYGSTPLHDADTKEVAELLIAKGADVNAKNDYGNTPLHSAVEGIGNHKQIVELLIAEGADVNAKRKIHSETPLDIATRRNKTEIATILRKHGAKTGEELKTEGK